MRDPHRRVLIPTLLLAGFAAVLIGGCGSDSTTTAPLPGNVDLSPPLAPTGLAVIQGTSTKVDVTWTPGTEPDLAGYRVYISIEGEGACVSGASPLPRNKFSFSGSPGTTYRIQVSAVDGSNNESALSESASFTYTVESDTPLTTPGGSWTDQRENEQAPDVRNPGHEPYDQPTRK